MKPPTRSEALFEASGTLDFLMKKGLARRPPDPISSWEAFRGFHPSPHMQPHRRRYAPTGPLQLGSRHFLASRGLCRTPTSAPMQSALWPRGPCVQPPVQSHACVPSGVPPAKGVGRVELPLTRGSYRGLPEASEQPGRGGCCGTGGHERRIFGNPPRGVTAQPGGVAEPVRKLVPAGRLGQSTTGTNIVPGTKGSGGEASPGTVGRASKSPGRGDPLPFYDAHSHLFVVTEGAAETDPTAGLPVQGRLVGRLAGMASVGVDKMVISGKVDPTELHQAADSWDLNRAVARAVQRAAWGGANFFVPLANLMTETTTERSKVRWAEFGAIEDFLGAAPRVGSPEALPAFKGVGELLVHGHGSYQTDNDVLLALSIVAARYGVPIVFHWDFGTTDDETEWPHDKNFEQLTYLLDALDEALARNPVGAQHLDVVICHCGAGPDGAQLTDDPRYPDFNVLYSDYVTNMNTLLARDTTYTKVHFDLAGMQVGNAREAESKPSNAAQQLYSFSSGYLTPLGDFILELIGTWPDRFMVGLDMDPQPSQLEDFHYSIYDYELSIRCYTAFLASVGESAAQAVLYDNAVALFGR